MTHNIVDKLNVTGKVLEESRIGFIYGDVCGRLDVVNGMTEKHKRGDKSKQRFQSPASVKTQNGGVILKESSNSFK